MKATGIVRRIDDLGRVVIPKEIRRTMRIREGDPLEIYTDAQGEVIFKKYSPVGELAAFAETYAESLSGSTKLAVAIVDRDGCVAAAGVAKREVLERRNTPELEEVLEQRRPAVFSGDGPKAFVGSEFTVCAVIPIFSAGDLSGAVLLGGLNPNGPAEPADIKLATVAAHFLGRQME